MVAEAVSIRGRGGYGEVVSNFSNSWRSVSGVGVLGIGYWDLGMPFFCSLGVRDQHSAAQAKEAAGRLKATLSWV